MKKKNIVFLVLLFLVMNTVTHLVLKESLNYKIDIVLDNNLQTLSTHYKILLETQKTTAQAIYETTLTIDKVIEIMTEANTADENKKSKLRAEFARILQPFYNIITKKGVLQYQFLFPNNESFYRAHKPSKFGDNLTDIRADFKYVNEHKKQIRGFVQGRVAHGFRNTFPLFSKDNKHIGAMEVSFSSDRFQWYLNNISNIHTHFLVNKDIFDAKAWQRDDLILKYDQCAETKDYMITLDSIHMKKQCIDNNKKRLESIREELDSKIKIGNIFSLYVEYRGEIDTISSLPIKSLDNKTIAWIVSYEKSPIIQTALETNIIIRISVFFLSLLIIYFLSRQILSKQKIEIQKKDLEKQHKLLNDILNSTDNIMFITDFKDIKFSNDKFRDMLNIKDIDLFNSLSNHNMLDIFLNVNGSLHQDMLEDSQHFVSLITKTPLKDRIVTIEDKRLEKVMYKISVSKSENMGDYLVTLSDITKMKEHYLKKEKEAYIDKLTGVYNRNKFDEEFKIELEYVQIHNMSFSIAILDIDKFKNFNDKYGHLIGDEVLITMAQAISEQVRDTDVFARWGGEEFIILFKNTSIDKAKKVVSKLKDIVENNEHPTAGKITASFGITEYISGDTEKTIFERCDKALYLAKKNGRNRIEIL